MTSFSSLSEHCTNDLLCFHPTQRRAELRHLETTRNKEEGQGLPVSTTQQEWLWFSVSCSAENPRNFAMMKPTASIVIENPLKILVLITPQGSILADSNCLSHLSPPPSIELLQPVMPWDPGASPASSPDLLGWACAKPHPRPLQLLRCLYYISGKQ